MEVSPEGSHYRVLVVDDEEPVLDSYEFMLNAGGSAFSLAGKARSGYEALHLILETKPDLVFMDINIPGKDGLEVIADAQGKGFSGVFILSTAYERFDLAQRAIPLGVFDYLVKPVSKKTFLASLNKVKEHLDARSRPGEEFPEALPPASLPWFLRRKLPEPLGEAEWEEYRTRFGFSSGKGLVFILQLEEPSEEAGKIFAAIEKKISLRYQCCVDPRGMEALFLILGAPEGLESWLEAVLASISPGIHSPGIQYGAGSPRRGTELSLSYREAREALESRRRETGRRDREQGAIAALRRKAGIAPPEEVIPLFERLWKEVFAQHSFEAAKAKMTGVFMLLLEDATGCYGTGEEAPLFDPAREIAPLEDPAAWERWSAGALEKLLARSTLRQRSFPLPLMKAIQFIQEHYAQGIQLADAAGAALVSPAYLSRLFQEYLKTSFISYITEFRITQAARMIRESALSIKEISLAVGYQDPNYFSKLFRKITGSLPSRYGEEEV